MIFHQKYDQLFGLRDNDINRIVQDYRAGRIDSATFSAKVAAWKKDWHDSIRDLIPGHRLEVLVDANSRLPLFRLTFTGYDTPPTRNAEEESNRLQTLLLPQRDRLSPFGRSR